MNPKQLATGAVIGISAVMMLSCGIDAGVAQKQGGNRRQGASTADPGPEVLVARVVFRQLSQSVRLPAELSAYQDVSIYPKLQGFVERIPVDRGSTVKRGELLVQLSAPELASRRAEAEAAARAAAAQRLEAASKLESTRAQKLEAEARLAADEATYQRLKSAAATPGVVAGNDLEIARRTADADRARVQSWEENEKAARAQIQALQESEKAAADAAHTSRDIETYLRITAPFDGVITERNVHEGSLAGPANGPASPPMLRIQQISTLRLVVSVPEFEVAGIVPGNKIDFTVPAFPGETFSGITRRIAHALDTRSRTMPVELDVTNASGRLSPGMYAEVAWPLKRPDSTLFVPLTSIASTTERIFVNRIRDNVVDWIDVKRGGTMANLVEVFGDLAPGDLVAVRGTDELRTGTRVRVKLQ